MNRPNGVTTEFVLDENTAYVRILGEVRSDGGERLYAYGPEGFSAQLAVGGGVEYPLLDGLGSVRQLTDASGTVILTRSYDAYGNTGRPHSHDLGTYRRLDCSIRREYCRRGNPVSDRDGRL